MSLLRRANRNPSTVARTAKPTNPAISKSGEMFRTDQNTDQPAAIHAPVTSAKRGNRNERKTATAPHRNTTPDKAITTRAATSGAIPAFSSGTINQLNSGPQ